MFLLSSQFILITPHGHKEIIPGKKRVFKDNKTKSFPLLSPKFTHISHLVLRGVGESTIDDTSQRFGKTSPQIP